jgi:hypothetical protein
MGLMLTCVQERLAARQRFQHRRRTPNCLRQFIGKGELAAPLERTWEEALCAYPS